MLDAILLALIPCNLLHTPVYENPLARLCPRRRRDTTKHVIVYIRRYVLRGLLCDFAQIKCLLRLNFGKCHAETYTECKARSNKSHANCGDAHRISLARDSNRIVAADDGELLECCFSKVAIVGRNGEDLRW